jgi:hypothetical protein
MALNVAARFYRVERRDPTAPEFADCLTRLSLLTEDQLVRDVADAIIQMDSPHQTDGIFFGDLIRLQEKIFQLYWNGAINRRA